jgi:hypothetical protein
MIPSGCGVQFLKMTARPLFPFAVAGTLLLLPVACGTSKPATDLQIRVHDSENARTYRLSCEPDDGTVPDPAAACEALAARRGLLVGGIGFGHPCPAGPAWTEVVGSSRGKDISITFSACNYVPGQAPEGDWLNLVAYRSTGPNRYGHASTNAPLQSVADRRHADRTRASLQRRSIALGRQARRLYRIREAELRTGTLSLEAAMRPDPLTRRILQLNALAEATRGGYPHPSEARLYVGDKKESRSFLVTVVVGAGQVSMAYEARSLRPTMWGIGPRRPTNPHSTPLLG